MKLHAAGDSRCLLRLLVPYGVIFALVLLVQRPGTPVTSVVTAGIWEVGRHHFSGLAVRVLVRRIQQSELSRQLTLALSAVVVLAYESATRR